MGIATDPTELLAEPLDLGAQRDDELLELFSGPLRGDVVTHGTTLEPGELEPTLRRRRKGQEITPACRNP